MDYLDDDYLKLFKNDNLNDKYENLNETTKYNNLEKLYETPVNKYNMNENINDSWGEFEIERRINGVTQNNHNQPQQYYNRIKKADLNGLNKYIDDDNDIREVFKIAKPIQQPKPVEPSIPQAELIVEKFDGDFISIELFEKVKNNSLLNILNKSNIKQSNNNIKDFNDEQRITVNYLKS
jgi:hypothetical protein